MSVYVCVEGHFRALNIALASPFVVAAIFFSSVAQVELAGDHLRYRRLVRWRIVPYSDIRDCYTDWVLGVLKTKYHLGLWGRLYFTRQQVGLGWDKEIIESIQLKAGLKW